MGLSERLVAPVTDIRRRGQRLTRLHRELLSSELREKGRQFGTAVGLFVGAGVLALYAIGFALATIAAALALVLPLWLSLLIVTAVLFLIIAVMVLVGRSQLQQGKELAPKTALAEARTTADLIKANARETAAGVRAKVASEPTVTGAGAAPPGPAPMAERPGQVDRPSEPPSNAGVRDS